jgi:hypothetical protein
MHKTKLVAFAIAVFFILTTSSGQSAQSGSNTRPKKSIVYTNQQYGFKFYLPKSWKGYSIIVTNWEGGVWEPQPDGTGINNDQRSETGPKILIRNPRWTEDNPYQDIPIMVFTLSQWDLIDKDRLVVSAAPFGPGELGRNCRYVFALPPRYNYADAIGVAEVSDIMRGQPLLAF